MHHRCSEIRRRRVKLPYGSEIMLRIVKLHFVQLRCDKVTLDRSHSLSQNLRFCQLPRLREPRGLFCRGEHCSSILSLPFEGSETANAVLNDSPVGCQTRGVTEPQRDRGTALAVDEVS